MNACFGASQDYPFPTANRAVHDVRKAYAKRTNAYLYISFKVDDHFILADDLRRSRAIGVPLEEAFGFQLAKILVKKEHKMSTASKLELAAEELLDERPDILETARGMLP